MNSTRLTEYILTALNLNGIGRSTVLKFFKTNQKIPEDLSSYKDCVSNDRILNKKKQIEDSDFNEANDSAKATLENCVVQDVKYINYLDVEYPKSLLELSNPPLVLFLKGNVDLLNIEKTVGIVGTRNPTSHGIKKGSELSELAAKEGFNIISGLALGSDTIAHKAAVEAGGYTTGVLGNGLDRVYPKQNEKLASDILNKSGLLISEYPPNTPMQPYQLTDRDRIQAGLSNGLIVIETGIKGGTQHTIKHIVKLKRPLACVFSHTEAEKLNESVGGNIKMVEENIATPLLCNSDMKQFLESIQSPVCRVEQKDIQGELQL